MCKRYPFLPDRRGSNRLLKEKARRLEGRLNTVKRTRMMRSNEYVALRVQGKNRVRGANTRLRTIVEKEILARLSQAASDQVVSTEDLPHLIIEGPLTSAAEDAILTAVGWTTKDNANALYTCYDHTPTGLVWHPPTAELTGPSPIEAIEPADSGISLRERLQEIAAALARIEKILGEK